MSHMVKEVVVPNPKTMMMYRRFLKAMMRVFKGDYEMFHRSRIALRANIQEYAHIGKANLWLLHLLYSLNMHGDV